jgi:hypothetical protein
MQGRENKEKEKEKEKQEKQTHILYIISYKQN